MNKVILSMMCALATACALASENGSVQLSFNRAEVYADGKTPVAPGTPNVYALVWVPASATANVAFDMAGNLVSPEGAKLITDLDNGTRFYRQSAKAVVRFVDVEFHADRYADYGLPANFNSTGVFRLFLMDNLKYDEKTGAYLGTEYQLAGCVGELASYSGQNSYGTAVNDVDYATTALSVQAGEPPIEESPRIIKVEDAGDNVILTVDKTDARLNYNVAAGDKPGVIGNREAAAAPLTGKGSGNAMTLVVPKNGKPTQFLRVIRHGSK